MSSLVRPVGEQANPTTTSCTSWQRAFWVNWWTNSTSSRPIRRCLSPTQRADSTRSPPCSLRRWTGSTNCSRSSRWEWGQGHFSCWPCYYVSCWYSSYSKLSMKRFRICSSNLSGNIWKKSLWHNNAWFEQMIIYYAKLRPKSSSWVLLAIYFYPLLYLAKDFKYDGF